MCVPLRVLRADARVWPRRGAAIFEKAARVYSAIGLTPNDGKAIRGAPRGVVLGAEVDGIAGIVGVLMLRVAIYSKVSYNTLGALIACWVHELLYCLPLFAFRGAVFQ